MKALILMIILAAPAVQAQDETQQIEDVLQMSWCAGFIAALGDADQGRGYVIAAGQLAETLATADLDVLVQLMSARMEAGKAWADTYARHMTPEEVFAKGKPCVDINPQVTDLVKAWRVAGVTK